MTDRSQGGRFAPGVSGNPGGRPRNPNSARQIRARLADNGDALAAKAMELAMGGDVQALRLCLDKLVPSLRPEALPAEVALPEGGGLAGTAWAFVKATADGELPADQAAQLVGALGTLARITEIDELEKRLAALEEAADGT